jgi:hypothetical protein
MAPLTGSSTGTGYRQISRSASGNCRAILCIGLNCAILLCCDRRRGSRRRRESLRPRRRTRRPKQEGDHRRLLLRRGDALERDWRDHQALVAAYVQRFSSHVGGDHAGRHRIHGYTLQALLAGLLEREIRDPGLGHRIAYRSGLAHKRGSSS